MIAKSVDTKSIVILQGYNWNSWKKNKSYFKYLESKSEVIKNIGIDAIWFPPCSKSVSPQGYLPLDYYDLNSEYGNKNDLLDCIKAFKENNIDIFGDIVINHRCAEFQNHEGIYNVFGGKLPWSDKAIISNDENFKGKGESSNFKIFDAAPNIDHSQDFVKADLIDWMLWLKNDIGFSGFRFDFMTGIDPVYMKEYFTALDLDFCIGEYWDDMDYDNGFLKYDQNNHRQRIINWIDNSGKMSFAFDMTTKGILQEALKNKEYWRLADSENKPPGLIGWWKEKSITFLDNHDTHYQSQNHWPFPKENVVEGYVYILTHPGIPMICWDDLRNDKIRDIIKLLIKFRKYYNINCESSVNIINADCNSYIAEIDNILRITIGEKDQVDGKILFKSDNVQIMELTECILPEIKFEKKLIQNINSSVVVN